LLTAGLILITASCSDAGGPERARRLSQALSATGTLSISGQVADANGLGLAGVTVTLSRPLAQDLKGVSSSSQHKTVQTIQTGADGTYAFSGLAVGSSFSVRPTLKDCSFDPDAVSLGP
jgi:hypothetical protein